ncbi:uncharacterized protein LOC132628624 [Lycium barbarum]|uniref:uncharacterized protein LOC132628624 n=1 Tax=Lycium barbarum TaxID=112863 RepID=UPI00293F79CA|nr:uncharacterized protein LOC132628624 [Lycium barbarum]
MNEEEKIGGVPIVPQDYEDIAFCINSCDLFEIGFKGSPFTWWNGRAGDNCMFERLDRIFFNSQFQQWFGHIEVEHLSRTGSDHAPLLITLGEEVQTFINPFRFLKFWTEHKDFLDIVRLNWSEESVGNPFLVFKQKIKILKGAPSAWKNRIVFQLAQAEMKKYLHYKEDFWRQKAGYTWLSEGDRSTRFFHNLVNGRRKRLQVNRIQISDGEWIEDKEQLAAEAVKFF